MRLERLDFKPWNHANHLKHNFAWLWTIRSGFESSHNTLGTNLGCFFTFLDGVMVHHRLFGHNFTIFGVKYPCFHGWHPLFILQIPSLLNSLHPQEKNGRCRSNNGNLTPKTSFRLGFWGQMPFFPWVTLTFFSLNEFVIEFWLF